VAAQDGMIMVRSTADPEGAMLEFGDDAWRAWIASLKQSPGP
jgi:hypothetical protein